MSKLADSNSKKYKKIKDEVEDSINDEELTRLDRLKTGRRNFS